MASFAAAVPPSYDVVFSYQGAFGPPTYGHYKERKEEVNENKNLMKIHFAYFYQIIKSPT